MKCKQTFLENKSTITDLLQQKKISLEKLRYSINYGVVSKEWMGAAQQHDLTTKVLQISPLTPVLFTNQAHVCSGYTLNRIKHSPSQDTIHRQNKFLPLFLKEKNWAKLNLILQLNIRKCFKTFTAIRTGCRLGLIFV